MAATPTTSVDFSQLNSIGAGGQITPKFVNGMGGDVFSGGSSNSANTNTSYGKAAPTPSSYPVVTSNAANTNFNSIQQDYQNNIAPKIQNAQTNAQAQNTLPVIAGYNVSANPTGNQGETKATNKATGGVYYITPQNQAPTANDVKNMLSSTDSGANPNPAPANDNPVPTTPSQQAQSQTGINPTTENSNFQGQIQGATDEISQAYGAFKNTVNQIMSGSFPLTGAQQSLVDATNKAFEQMNTQANLKAAALSSETGGVSDKVNATAGELLNITSQQSAAVAKLEIAFQDKNYQMITDSYNEFKDLEKSKMDSITSLHNAVMDTYNKALAADQAQQTFNQTAIHNAATLAQSQYEFRDLKDAFGNTIGTQVFDKATGSPVSSHYSAGQTDPKTGVTTPIVTTDPNSGTVDQAAQAAYLQTVPSAYRALVQGIVNGKIEPPSARTAKGAQILSWVAGADPTLSDGSGGFDSTKYAARLAMQKSLASYSSGSYGSGILSANKAISHLASFADSVGKMGNASSADSLNSIGNSVKGLFSPSFQTSQRTAETEANGLKDELAKFFKGTGTTDVKSIEDWSQSLNPNETPGHLTGTVQGALTLMTGQLDSFIQQYKTVMGKDPDMGTILQPQTVQTLSGLKNQGYKIDLPGVYYTDKGAWQDNGGTQEQWNSAVDTLTTHGIPLTQDNILQTAQIINE